MAGSWGSVVHVSRDLPSSAFAGRLAVICEESLPRLASFLLLVRTGETRGSFRGRCRALQDRLLWACSCAARSSFRILRAPAACAMCKQGRTRRYPRNGRVSLERLFLGPFLCGTSVPHPRRCVPLPYSSYGETRGSSRGDSLQALRGASFRRIMEGFFVS